MVLRCGRKPSGEEVSVSLVYALGLRTDQTIVRRREFVARFWESRSGGVQTGAYRAKLCHLFLHRIWPSAEGGGGEELIIFLVDPIQLDLTVPVPRLENRK